MDHVHRVEERAPAVTFRLSVSWVRKATSDDLQLTLYLRWKVESFPYKTRSKTRMSLFPLVSNTALDVLARAGGPRKGSPRHPSRKGRSSSVPVSNWHERSHKQKTLVTSPESASTSDFWMCSHEPIMSKCPQTICVLASTGEIYFLKIKFFSLFPLS